MFSTMRDVIQNLLTLNTYKIKVCLLPFRSHLNRNALFSCGFFLGSVNDVCATFIIYGYGFLVNT